MSCGVWCSPILRGPSAQHPRPHAARISPDERLAALVHLFELRCALAEWLRVAGAAFLLSVCWRLRACAASIAAVVDGDSRDDRIGGHIPFRVDRGQSYLWPLEAPEEAGERRHVDRAGDALGIDRIGQLLPDVRVAA